MGLIQSELDKTHALWNSHRIREVQHSECPLGLPDNLYYLPSNQGAREYGSHVDARDIELAKSFCQVPSKVGCSLEILVFALLLMSENLKTQWYKVYILKPRSTKRSKRSLFNNHK